MATWNQGGIAGGLLGGIGGVNSNAPRATDANTALSLIRENNDIQRSGANNPVLQGLQGLYGVAQMYQADQQAQRQQEFFQKYGTARAAGDTASMRQLFAEYPEMNEQIGKGMEGISADTRESLGNVAANFRMAVNAGTGDQFVAKNAAELMRLGIDPKEAQRLAKADPKGAVELADTIGMSALTPEKYFDAVDAMTGRQIDREKLAETVRSNQAGEALTARRDEQSNARGWAGINIQQQNANTSRGRLEMDRQKQSSKSSGGDGERTVQLSDGRTVTVSGKLHGAGANAFYEGVDNSGNTVRVPANSIAAPASSSENATNYAMKKDMDLILNAKPEQLEFMTGMTGGLGSPAVGADYLSRWSGKEERQIYAAARRIQGRMQNQGIAAARDMGASGINTVAEANMYFQGMNQIDHSSPEAAQQSIRDIQEYTNNYNQQYNADVGGSKPSSKQQPAQQQSGYSSLWGD